MFLAEVYRGKLRNQLELYIKKEINDKPEITR